VVKDFGTVFDVNAYNKKATKVALIKGKVEVATTNSRGGQEDFHVMKPGELCLLPRHNKKIPTSSIDTSAYTAWTRHKLVFEDTPLAEVAKRLENIYGTPVRFRDKQLKKIRVSGSLPNNGLYIFMNALRKMLHRRVTYNDGIITVGSRK
jgi:ferric-dicitrate binding protein FerR (iron transport regulator)